MQLGQGHGGVKTDDREAARHRQNGLDDRFAHLGHQVIQLGRIVPWHGRAIIAMIDIVLAPIPVVVQLENHRRIGAREVMIFQVDADPAVTG